MHRIVHLSDLHFGAACAALVDALLDALRAASPTLIVVSGDFTQRARAEEFRAAHRFLAQLSAPTVTVPGNHDVPLYDVWRRVWRPLAHYRKYVSPDLAPVYEDPELVVAGVDTTRRWRHERGTISTAQADRLCARFALAPASAVRVVVSHHFLSDPRLGWAKRPAHGGRTAVRRLVRCGADLFLAGHSHVSCAVATAIRVPGADRAALVVTAGTATSWRGRGEPNAFNLLSVSSGAIDVARFEHDAARGFTLVESSRFESVPSHGWRSVPVSQNDESAPVSGLCITAGTDATIRAV